MFLVPVLPAQKDNDAATHKRWMERRDGQLTCLFTPQLFGFWFFCDLGLVSSRSPWPRPRIRPGPRSREVQRQS